MAERNSTDHSHSPCFNSLCKALYFDIDNNVHKCLFGNPKENGKEIETCKGCPNQYSSVTVADIYAIRKYFEDYFNNLKLNEADFAEIDEKLKAFKMFFKMNPHLYTPGRKPRIY